MAWNFTSAKDALVNYLNSSSAATVHALNPRPTAFDCENPKIEEVFAASLGGVIGVDDTSFAWTQAATSANNRAQRGDYAFDLYVSTTGPDRATARDNVRTIVSAIAEDLIGSGAYLSTDRTQVFAAVPNSWAWASPASDDLVADATMSITLTCYHAP